jgi:hypothetical protein
MKSMPNKFSFHRRVSILIILLILVLVDGRLFSQVSDESYGYSKPTSFTIIKDGLPFDKLPLNAYIKIYINNNMSEWLKKGEFEKTADYQLRTSQQFYNEKVRALTMEAEDLYKIEFSKTIDWSGFTLNPYDADNELFTISSDQFGDYIIKVPIDEAPSLKQNWQKVEFSDQEYTAIGNTLNLKKVKISNPVNNLSYFAENKSQSINQTERRKTSPINKTSENQNVSSEKVTITDYPKLSYTELVTLKSSYLQKGESETAKMIQGEISRRELSGQFTGIPTERLEKILNEAIKAEDFNRAAKIQDELEKRNKK